MVAAPPRQPNDSHSAVRAPACAAPTAAAVPAAPPPTTATSYTYALDGRCLSRDAGSRRRLGRELDAPLAVRRFSQASDHERLEPRYWARSPSSPAMSCPRRPAGRPRAAHILVRAVVFA